MIKISKMKTALEVLSNRLTQKKRTGTYRDEHKLCLAVEGGGIMGAISCGMLLALIDLELMDLFDVYVGSSSGSVNLTYGLAGYPEEGLSVYYEHMVNHRMVDTFRIVKGGYAIDLKILAKLLKKYIPSPVEILNKIHPSDFYITVASLKPTTGHLVSIKDAGDRFFDYLIAGCTIPYISGRPVSIDRKKYCDGGFAYPDLRIAARELGSTHVVVLTTQPTTGPINRYDSFAGKGYRRLLSKTHLDLEKFWEGRLAYAEHIHAQDPVFSSSNMRAQHVTFLAPNHQVGTFSNEKWLIIDGARKGYESVVKMFLKDATVGLVPEVI